MSSLGIHYRRADDQANRFTLRLELKQDSGELAYYKFDGGRFTGASDTVKIITGYTYVLSLKSEPPLTVKSCVLSGEGDWQEEELEPWTEEATAQPAPPGPAPQATTDAGGTPAATATATATSLIDFEDISQPSASSAPTPTPGAQTQGTGAELASLGLHTGHTNGGQEVGQQDSGRHTQKGHTAQLPPPTHVAGRLTDASPSSVLTAAAAGPTGTGPSAGATGGGVSGATGVAPPASLDAATTSLRLAEPEQGVCEWGWECRWPRSDKGQRTYAKLKLVTEELGEAELPLLIKVYREKSKHKTIGWKLRYIQYLLVPHPQFDKQAKLVNTTYFNAGQ